MANLASTCYKLGKYTKAEKLWIQVLNARKIILGVEHLKTIDAMANLASTCYKLGKYTKAEKLWIQVLDSRKKNPGPEHPDAMANDIATKFLQATVADKLQVQVIDAGKEVVEREHLHMTKAHTYTTLQIENKMKEMEVMSAEGKVPSGSGDGNKNKQEENMPQGRVMNNDPQRGGEKDSEGDDDDSKGNDPDIPDMKGSSGADIPKISFNIQTEIYPNTSSVFGTEQSSTRFSEPSQVLQLEGSITVQVGYPSKLIHKRINIVSDKTSTVRTKAASKLLY